MRAGHPGLGRYGDIHSYCGFNRGLDKMTHFRLRWEKRGGHVHMRVFSAERAGATHGKNGDLVFREAEWESFLRCFQDCGTDTVAIKAEGRGAMEVEAP
jgi:hypothetical protein